MKIIKILCKSSNAGVLNARRLLKASDATHRRSQAALEFLATYGWAFLVILIVIAALSYFGILSPSKLLPDRCNFGAEFGCTDYSIGSNGLNLRLKNSVGEAIIIDGITVSSEDKPLNCPFTASATPWKSGETKAILIACTDFATSGLVAGEKGKLNLKIKYHNVRSSSAFAKDVNGEVFAVVKGGAVALGASCKDIGASSGDGIYTISPDSINVISVYCDMTTDGGGWTLVARMTNGCRTDTRSAVGTITSPSQPTCAKLSDADINAIRTNPGSQGIFWGYHEGSPYALPPTGRFLKIITGEFNADSYIPSLTQQCSCVSSGLFSATYDSHGSMAGVYTHSSGAWQCVTVGANGCTSAHVYPDGLFLYQHPLHIEGTFPAGPHGVPGGKNGWLYLR